MIAIRDRIVSIAAVLLALATGIVLATGPFGSAADDQRAEPADRHRSERLRERLDVLRRTARFEAAFTAAVTPAIVDQRLSGRSVVVLTLPQARAGVVAAARRTLTDAGARVEPTMRLTQRLLDPANKQLIEELSTQLLGNLVGVSVPPGAATYERIGALLARALLTDRDAGAPRDAVAANLLTALHTARLVAPDNNLGRRASLVLIISGAKTGTDETTQARNSIVQALARALDAGGDGVVVAGPPQSGAQGGVVWSVRADPPTARLVSTVDVLTLPSGRVSAVYALSQQAHGDSGHYGTNGSTNSALTQLAAPDG